MKTPESDTFSSTPERFINRQRNVVAPGTFDKIPTDLRQEYFNLIVGILLERHMPDRIAFRQAFEEEKSVYNRSETEEIYQNAIGDAINRLKRAAEADNDIGALPGRLFQLLVMPPKERWLFLPFTPTGLQLYKLLEKYIMKPEEMTENGFPMPDPFEKGRAHVVANAYTKKDELPPLSNPSERRCHRCATTFLVDEQGVPLKKEVCIYHWGKLITRKIRDDTKKWVQEIKYGCCNGKVGSVGCYAVSSHIVEPNDENSCRGFVSTLPKTPPPDGNWGVYALDCEMCHTTAGLELTRVTVVGSDCQIVYETLVKPDNPILDYNTRFSGIMEKDLINVKTNIKDVQSFFLNNFSDKTILIGHSLENDFKALKIFHTTVIDTSVVFPHNKAPIYKHALRTLSADILDKVIQRNICGHDSAEDARTCMELMIWKVKEDLRRFC